MNVTVKAIIDKEIKEKAQANLKAMGLDMSTAIRTMLYTIAEGERLPLPYVYRSMSKSSAEALKERERGECETFDNVGDAMQWLKDA